MQTFGQSGSAMGAGLRRLRRAVGDRLRLWDARELERRFLASLTEAQLRDMRLTARQVREEAAKPFWKA